METSTPKNPFVDFKAIKSAVSMEQALGALRVNFGPDQDLGISVFQADIHAQIPLP